MAGQEVSTIASRWLASSLRRARVTAKPSGRGASCGVPVQQAAPPPPGAACCRPGDGDARPALTGHQQSPQVRQGVVLRCGPQAVQRGKGVQHHGSAASASPVSNTASRNSDRYCAVQIRQSRAHVRLRAGAPLRPPPRLREDATGPQRAGLGSPVRVTGAAQQDSRPGSPS
jgi:hypothetical protein